MSRFFASLIIASTTLLAAGVPLAIADSTALKTGDQILAEVSRKVTNISTADLQKEIDSSPDLVLIDIRTPGEINSMGGTIDAAQNVNIPRGWLEFRIGQRAAQKETPIVVYCGANYRSPLAAETLQQMGYSNVRNYAEGYLGWKKAGLPVAKP